jgi:hypothetical protein
MFDYVMILASIIIGLAMAHLMQGLAGLIQQPAKVRIWWVHLVWVAYMLFLAVFWWWFEYMLHKVSVWTFATYIFVLLYAFIIYMASALLFPRDLSGYGSYEEYFLARRAWFFGLGILSITIDPIDSALKGRGHVAQLGTEYWVSTVVVAVLFIVAIGTRRRSVHAVIAVSNLFYQISWAARLFHTVN